MGDLVCLAVLAAHSRSALAAANLFLRTQLALSQERKVKPWRADDSIPWMMATVVVNYTVTNRIVTVGGCTKDRSFTLRVQER